MTADRNRFFNSIAKSDDVPDVAKRSLDSSKSGKRSGNSNRESKKSLDGTKTTSPKAKRCEITRQNGDRLENPVTMVSRPVSLSSHELLLDWEDVSKQYSV